MGRGNEILYKWSRSHDKDGRHANINLQRTRSPMILKLGMQHQGLKLYKVYINYDPGLTLTYFTTRSNSGAYTFEWGKTVTKSFNGEKLQKRTKLTE